MKKALTLTLALAICLSVVGCAKKTTTSVPAAPPAGSLNTADATIDQTLEPIHAFVQSMVTQNNTGAIMLTAADKALLNQLVTDVNAADAVYLAWRTAGGTGSTTQVNTAIAKAQADQTSLNASIQGGK